MTKVNVSSKLKEIVPNFKIGVITYHNITVGESPQMLRGRLQFYQESLKLDAETKPVNEIPPIKEWREIFKTVGTDPSRYRPSSEALLRRMYKGKNMPFIHSAADTNNFFSLEYQIPFGIYDFNQIKGEIELTIGENVDEYEAINNKVVQFQNKLVSKDKTGAFGSPIVDSKRTMVTEKTTDAVQLIYLTPSLPKSEAEEMLAAASNMFIQINGGSSNIQIVDE